jgi:hypothetical protein
VTKDGFVVVQEERGEHTNHYTPLFSARIDKTLHISFTPFHNDAQAIADAYNEGLGLLRASQVGSALVAIVENLGGIRLRPNGAVYWLPENRIDEWMAAARAVESAGAGRPSAVYILRHQMDADAVRAVRDAIVSDVQGQVASIHEEVLSGELGEKALETRRQQAEMLREKIALYEDLLGVGLSLLRAAVDQADQAAGAAVLLASAQATKEDSHVA